MSDTSEIQITRSNRRTLSLHILPDGTLLVKAPLFMTRWEINRFIKKHEEWIQKKREVAKKSPASKTREYTEGEEFFYLGKRYTLTFGAYTAIAAKDDTLLFPRALTFRIKKELETWYIRQAKKIITEQVEYFAKEMNATYISLSFSDTSSKWGSCTHDNRLQFNWRLVMAPLMVLNYVVIHELAHTMEKNHSVAFWSLVGRFTPSFRTQRKWLNLNGHTLQL